jgi:hypothetical protein
MSTIRVRIEKNGAVTLDVIGGHGASCSLLTKTLQEALGPVAQESFKPEYCEEQLTSHDTITH